MDATAKNFIENAMNRLRTSIDSDSSMTVAEQKHVWNACSAGLSCANELEKEKSDLVAALDAIVQAKEKALNTEDLFEVLQQIDKAIPLLDLMKGIYPLAKD